jgi:hypothetical protein
LFFHISRFIFQCFTVIDTADEVDATFVTAHDLTDDDHDNTITVELHNSDKMDTEERKSRKSSENEKDTEVV